MYPGRVVKGGSTNNEMIVGAADALSMGWLSYEDTPVMYRPATIDTIYKVNDRAAYVFGPGMVVVASLLYQEEIVMGNKLVPTAAGQLKKWTPTTDSAQNEEDVIAIAMETVTSGDNKTDHDATDIIVRSLI
jgi:predicted NAD/FAD-dependent oxidoreductase